MGTTSTHNINILTFNAHVGICASSEKLRIMNAWKHFLPSSDKIRNLDRMAKILNNFDVVGIQESDGGSLRSNFVNQTIHLAYVSGFDYCSEKINRNLGFARHSIGILSKYPIIATEKYSLPGSIPGRGLLVASLDVAGSSMTVAVVHLSLGKKDRVNQAHFIAEILQRHKERIILMGDFNCCHDSEEIRIIVEKTGLHHASAGVPTSPSWKPFQCIDHLFASENLQVNDARTLGFRFSDHLPLAAKARIEKTKSDNGA